MGTQPKYRISSNGYGGYFVMAWSNSRGYYQVSDTFGSREIAHLWLSARIDRGM
jgi:hypothetical protein